MPQPVSPRRRSRGLLPEGAVGRIPSIALVGTGRALCIAADDPNLVVIDCAAEAASRAPAGEGCGALPTGPIAGIPNIARGGPAFRTATEEPHLAAKGRAGKMAASAPVGHAGGLIPVGAVRGIPDIASGRIPAHDPDP